MLFDLVSDAYYITVWILFYISTHFRNMKLEHKFKYEKENI